MVNAINWFEIPVIDFAKAKKFYESIFGYTMDAQDMMGFQMGFFKCDKEAVGGAIVKGEGYKPSTEGTVVYLNGGDDLTTVLSKVEAAGGKVVLPKTLITAEIGYWAFFIDVEGNKIGLHSVH
ncbi:MAG: VOC family protein [Ignavibacteriales bacterium]|nr:VOC family protein [Ignavibacteriales bacterium]